MALPIAQTPYYASRFPQHPQNLGYGGDYPKYWQGEAYNPEVAPNYNGYTGPAAAVAPETERKEQRPSFTDTKYPAREAIKHYSGTAFPGSGSGASEDSANGQNIKITNDTPSDNDKSYTRITKGPGVGLRKKKTSAKPAEEEDKEPEHRSGGLEDIADLATPRFDGTIPSEEQEEQDSNWGSFTFGVVSDSLVYHDPYENRRDEFERKTDALSKIERMMGHSFVSADDTVEKRSLGKRDWPEHIQEKALKMMDSASNMQTKGQKTIDNDPQYQASLKGGQEAPNAPEPAQSSGPKNTFPVGPNSKKAQAAQSPPPPPPPPAPAPAPPAERKLGSGGGGLVPPHKAGKVAKTKGKAPPALGNPAPPEPQQQQQPSQPMGRQQGNMPSQGRGNPQRPQERQPGAQRPKNKAQGKQRPQQNQPNLMKRQVAVPAG